MADYIDRAQRYTTGVCRTGKRAFAVRKDAKTAARLAAKGGLGNLRAYTCRACGFWHIGHPPREWSAA